MDTFAHALLSGALRKGVSKEKPLSRWSFAAALFWGAFPDIFAFWPIFVTLIMTGGFTRGARMFLGIDVRSLYEFSHSLVIALGAVVIVYLVWRFFLKRAFPYAILGWPLHIILDMPTHAPGQYSTPFLYPLSDFTLPFGLPWSTPWFWILTWIVTIAIYLYIYRRRIFHLRRKGVA